MTHRSLMALFPTLFPALFATLTALAPVEALAANQAPTVSLTAPAANTVRLAPASVTLTAIAADVDGSIAKVVFFRGTTRLFTDTSAPFSFVWKNIPAGTYSLTAQATDNAGAVTTSAPVTLQVNPQQPPKVSLTAPVHNTTVAPNSNVTLSANASDVDGSIAKVAFFRGTTRIGTDFTAPFSIVWNKVPAGTYSLTAQATDNIGAVTTSAPVTLRVMANPPPLVSLSSPVDGSQFVQGGPIRLEATASDGDGIAKVEFFHDSTLLATASQPPFSATWTPPAAGSYRLTAKASDTLGATTTSTVVTVTVTPTAATTLYYIESDHLGTPRAISDESGKTVWRWANREPFGDSPPETDPDGDGKPFEFNLRFPGQYYDAESGLHYNFYRDYDAGVGRYVESDPIGLAGGLNLYLYTNAAPTMFTDPLGLCPRGWKQAPGQQEGVCIPDGRVEPDKCASAACGAGLPEPLPPSSCVSNCLLAAISSAGRSCKYLVNPPLVAACKSAAKARATYHCAKNCGDDTCGDKN